MKSILRRNQAQPRQSEEYEEDQNLSGPEKKLNNEYERNDPDSTRHLERLHQRQMQMRTTASSPRELEGKTLEGENSVTKKDVERFGPTARCPACANTTKGISGRHAHNDESRDRIGKLLIDEDAQRIENYFKRTRVREETGSGGTATSSRSETVMTGAQRAKRKGDDETNEMDERSKKRQTGSVVGTPVPTVYVGGSSASGGRGHSLSPTPTEQRVVVPPEVPQDTRNSVEDWRSVIWK